jgi:hypothetical protein
VTFTWSPAPGANKSYEFRLYNADTNALVLALSITGGLTSQVYTLASGNYRLEMRGCNPQCGTAFATAFSVALGAVPVSPPTGVVCSVANNSGQNRLDCSWAALAGADFYFIHVIQPNSGPGGGALTVAGTQVGGTSVSLPVPNGPANVVVRGCNGNGCGPFNAPVGVGPAFGNPAAPSLAEPFSGSVVDPGGGTPVVTFTWNRVAGDNGSNYRYRLYVQDFSRNAAAVDVTTTNNFHAVFLNPLTRYDALVIATPVSGVGSTQGPANGFVTRGTAPNTPSFTAPSVFSTVPAGATLIAWTPVPDSAGNTTNRLYQVQLFGPTAVNATTTDPFVVRSLAPGGYSGIVRACATLGATACSAGSDAGWGPYTGASGSQGGSTSFTAQ